MLAQVGRPGLVRDLAARLIAEFAGNLDRRMSGTSLDGAVATELSGASLCSVFCAHGLGAGLAASRPTRTERHDGSTSPAMPGRI